MSLPAQPSCSASLSPLKQRSEATSTVRLLISVVCLEEGTSSYTPSTPACQRGLVKIESMGESQRARPKDTVIIQQNFPKTYPAHTGQADLH